jgi:hypothetical protein
MEQLPVYINIFFGLTTLLTVYLFYKSSRNSKIVLSISIAWLLLQGIVASTGFYTITDTIPPRFMLLVLPPLAFICLLLLTKKGKKFIDGLDVKTLTLLHIVRIPVEFVLLLLFLQKAIPQIMTFEGRNFDIFSGITALFIYYFGFVRKTLNKNFIIAWNFICLALLVNIVSIAILSAPFTFQKIAFDQPNVAVFYFPFVWLPAFIVPVVLLSHLVSIRQLLTKTKPSRVMATPQVA